MNQPEYYPIEFLHWSAQTSQGLKKVKEILELYPEYINTVNQNNDNALMIAARVNQREMVDYLLENTNINHRHTNHEGNFIAIAIKSKNIELVKHILTNYSGIIDFSKKEEINMFNLCMPFVSNNKLDLIELVVGQADNIHNLRKFEAMANDLQDNDVRNKVNNIIQMYKLDYELEPKAHTKLIKI
jgi:ankyrin repeat protein